MDTNDYSKVWDTMFGKKEKQGTHYIFDTGSVPDDMETRKSYEKTAFTLTKIIKERHEGIRDEDAYIILGIALIKFSAIMLENHGRLEQKHWDELTDLFCEHYSNFDFKAFIENVNKKGKEKDDKKT